MDGSTPVVIGFSVHASPIEVAWPSTHRALLPLAGKPLIEHILDQLGHCGLRHLRIASCTQQRAIRSRLSDGANRDFLITYSDLHGEDLRLQTIAEFGRCIYLTGDEFHRFDERVMSDEQTVFRPSDPGCSEQGAAHWIRSRPCARRRLWADCEAGSYELVNLSSPRDYLRANLLIAGGELPTLVAPGRVNSTGAVCDWNLQIAKNVSMGRRVFIGRECRIERQVELTQDCVLAEGVIVGRGCRLSNVVILPNCQLGPGTQLKDAVVCPHGVYDLNGRYWPVDDRTRLDQSRESRSERSGFPETQIELS